jgi:hypothetical protein
VIPSNEGRCKSFSPEPAATAVGGLLSPSPLAPKVSSEFLAARADFMLLSSNGLCRSHALRARR